MLYKILFIYLFNSIIYFIYDKIYLNCTYTNEINKLIFSEISCPLIVYVILYQPNGIFKNCIIHKNLIKHKYIKISIRYFILKCYIFYSGFLINLRWTEKYFCHFWELFPKKDLISFSVLISKFQKTNSILS